MQYAIGEQGWRRLTRSRNDEHENDRLKFSRYENRGVVPLIIEDYPYLLLHFSFHFVHL